MTRRPRGTRQVLTKPPDPPRVKRPPRRPLVLLIPMDPDPKMPDGQAKANAERIAREFPNHDVMMIEGMRGGAVVIDPNETAS